MNERYSIQELATLLAGQTGRTKKESELFLRELVNVITEGVFQDKIVKVKGFGTFKIILVEKRESIHVNTGERFVIPAHRKFTFLPDKDLKVLVNKPFSFFETTQMADDEVIGTESEVMETEEEYDVDIIEEISVVEMQSTDNSSEQQAEGPLPENEVPEEIQEKLSAIENQERIEEPVPTENPIIEEAKEISIPETKSEKDQEMKVVAKSTDKTSSIKAPVETKKTTLSSSKKKESKSTAKTMSLVIGIVAVLLIILGSYWYMTKGTSTLSDVRQETERPAPQEQEAMPETDTQPEQNHLVSGSENDNSGEVVPTEEVQQPVVQNQQPSSVSSGQDSDEIGKITVKSGDRLTLYAEKYYGDKLFWVYIYDFNKAIMGNPDNLQIDMELTIPAHGVYGIDANSDESLNKARAFQREILNQYR